MQVLLTGATGFIGRALVVALEGRGHALTLAVRELESARRRWPQHRLVIADFATDHRADDWLDRLDGIDIVVNAVGIFREHGRQTFEAVHERAPSALFEACAIARVSHVVQISALGADAGAASAYHRSKRAADLVLARLPLRATIVRPSLVFAPDGVSARWFCTLAALPLVPLPGRGEQCLQPVHRDDLVAAITALIESALPPPVLDAVGPRPLTLRAYLAGLRDALGLGVARFLPVPPAVMRAAAALGARMPDALLDRDTLAMLERGNCADAAGITGVLGRVPRAPAAFLDPADAAALRRESQLRWLLPLLRVSLAAVWIVTGLVSLGLYPVTDSLALLARTGLTGVPAQLALYGAALLDLALGIGLLFARRRRWLYKAQAVLILGYTAIISLWLPEFWLHPYGPVLKNLPLLAVLWLLHELDDGRSGA